MAIYHGHFIKKGLAFFKQKYLWHTRHLFVHDQPFVDFYGNVGFLQTVLMTSSVSIHFYLVAVFVAQELLSNIPLDFRSIKAIKGRKKN